MDSPATPIPSISPQPAVESTVSAPAESPSRRWLLWLIGGLVTLIIGVAFGVFAAKFFNQSQSPSQLMPTPAPTLSPTPTPTPIVSPKPAAEADDPTADWKTYQSQVATFKYPPDWKLDTNGKRITSTSPTVDLWVFGKDDPMMNECMEEKNRKIVNNLLIRYFSHVQGTEACSNTDTWSQKEIWIVKAEGDGFQPGIIYRYSSDHLAKSEAIFDQILSTFKFLDQDNVSNLCTTDADCGVNICDCKADLNQNIPVAKKACARYCPGAPRCINNRCQLVDENN